MASSIDLVEMHNDISSESDRDVSRTLGCIHHNLLYRLIKPYLWLMRVGGLFFIRMKASPKTTFGDEATASERPTKFSCRLLEKASQLHSTLTLSMNILGLVFQSYRLYLKYSHFVFNFETMTTLVYDAINHLWLIQLICIHLSFYVACWKFSGVSDLLHKWDTAHYSCNVRGCLMGARYQKEFRQRQIFLLIAAVSHLALFLSWALYGDLSDGPDEASLPDVSPRANFAFYVTRMVQFTFSAFIYVMPTYFFAVLTSVIIYDFRHLHADLTFQLSNGTAFDRLDDYRMQHNRLCQFIRMADRLVSPFILLAIVGSVVLVLLQVFVIQSTLDSGEEILLYNVVSLFIWCLTYLMQILTILGMGSMVNEAAHLPTFSLYQIDQSCLSKKSIQGLQTFLSKLTCNRIGFTAWHTFPIERSAVVDVFGAYVTYQILIFVLRLDLKMDHLVENNSARCGCE